MSGRGRNWSKARLRDQIVRQGAESASVGRPRRGATAEAAAAEIVVKVLRCRCGHRGKVEAPAHMLAGKKFRCNSCQRLLP